MSLSISVLVVRLRLGWSLNGQVVGVGGGWSVIDDHTSVWPDSCLFIFRVFTNDLGWSVALSTLSAGYGTRAVLGSFH